MVVPSVPASMVTIAQAVAQVVARAAVGVAALGVVAVGVVALGEGTGAGETVWLESLRLTSCDAASPKGPS